MSDQYYRFSLADRRRFLADAGFIRNNLRIWAHPDGRAVGESVVMALTDEAFFRYLGIAPPEIATEAAEDSYEISIN